GADARGQRGGAGLRPAGHAGHRRATDRGGAVGAGGRVSGLGRKGMAPSPPSPLRGGTEGGGSDQAANSMAVGTAEPPPLTPPLKGEGKGAVRSVKSLAQLEALGLAEASPALEAVAEK